VANSIVNSLINYCNDADTLITLYKKDDTDRVSLNKVKELKIHKKDLLKKEKIETIDDLIFCYELCYDQNEKTKLVKDNHLLFKNNNHLVSLISYGYNPFLSNLIIRITGSFYKSRDKENG